METKLKGLSKFLSYILRHAPEHIELELDEYGWADIGLLIEKLNASGPQKIDIETLKLLVESNSKKRFAISDDGMRIRASQGHSIAIKHGYSPIKPPPFLYHGTSTKARPSILAEGIDKRSRQHVHLNSELATALEVGRRHGKPVVLKVLAEQMFSDGLEFYLSDNGVWLTDYVDKKYIGESDEE